MAGAEYRFRSTWWLPAAPAPRVFDAVVDLEAYPRWWSDVRSVRRVDDDTAEVVCQSNLPYRIAIAMHREEQDLDSGHLRVGLSGDLEGFLAGALHVVGPGTRLEITQHVRARKPLLRRLDVVARPFFRANHAWMMRRGHRGLITYLA
ncbi:SRPBCC family protein [Amycolatopsis sp. FDAARGOS 1241]|uniref:SRPBCC family protein n=1 Tax=Amycolatopsis sp. FDAARGOS 1241 TaxID=2778070 RepID=UPI00194ED2AE|nr:SRPBCC family protein [Amycolatopsis sp. FDAARGOS 1241]QRP48935.1 polyketide cyclase [Amycolatopsis sp. FDAARGOS 1241]